MARGHAPGRPHGGGGSVQAPRARWSRLIRVFGSLACAAALALYPPLGAGRLGWLHAAISVAAVALLAVAFALRKPGLFPWALALLGANYALWLALGTHALDERMPIVAAGLLLLAELAYDSLEPEVGRPEATVVLVRTIALALVLLAAVAAGAVVLALAAVPLHGGVAVTGLGALAAVLALALVTRLAADRR